MRVILIAFLFAVTLAALPTFARSATASCYDDYFRSISSEEFLIENLFDSEESLFDVPSPESLLFNESF